MHDAPSFLFITIQLGSFSLSCDTFLGDGPLQVLVGGGYQPDVEAALPGRAHRPIAFLLQGTQKEHLGPVGEVADLVQEQRAAVLIYCYSNIHVGKYTWITSPQVAVLIIFLQLE